MEAVSLAFSNRRPHPHHLLTIQAYAKLGQYDAALFTALARSTERHLDRLSAQGLANIVWAYAKAGHLDDKLYVALKTSIQQQLGAFNSQDLANTA